MSMSTQHGGGSRKPSTRPVAGAKRKPRGDEETVIETPADSAVADSDAAESDVADSDVADSDVADDAAVSDDVAESDDADEAPPAAKPRAKASPRKSATAKKAVRPGGASKTAGARPPVKSGRRVAPVKINQGRSWGPIALFTAVAVVALGIIGFAGWQVYENGLTYQERAARIDGITDYRKTDAKSVTQGHAYGPIQYKYNPPSAGTHNYNWQRCLGDVYPAAIASEHAVHSLEHGAIWITYNPSLPPDQVETLAKKVRGHDFMLMSPFPGLDKPISLQAWGYQLKVNNANDGRIDEFINVLKQKAGPEQGATCSSGNMITETGTTPRDLGKDQQGQPGG